MDAFTQQLLLKNDEQDKEIRELRQQVTEAEKVTQRSDAQAEAVEQFKAEKEKALEKAKAAEQARNAAERKAEKERLARIGVEGELDELKQRIAQLQEQPSRLKKLREEIGA